MNTTPGYASTAKSTCNSPFLLCSNNNNGLPDSSTNIEEDGPSMLDVICGRGRQALNHPGNKRFRAIVQDHYDSYANAPTKMHKSMVVSHIMKCVRMHGAGDFVRLDRKTGIYNKLTNRLAREKVGQGLRDVCHTKYSSSTKAKKRKRVAHREFEEEQLRKVVVNNSNATSILTDVTEKVSHKHYTTDTLAQIFLQANARILQELKQSNSADQFAAAIRASQEGDGSNDESEDIF